MAKDDDEETFAPESGEKEEPLDEEEFEVREGDKDEDVYEEAGREELTEEDEISPREEAFLEGEKFTAEESACDECESPLSDNAREVVELEMNEKKYFFCSEDCANKFKKKHKKEFKLK